MNYIRLIDFNIIQLFLGGWVLAGLLLNPAVSTPKDKELHDDVCSCNNTIITYNIFSKFSKFILCKSKTWL